MTSTQYKYIFHSTFLVRFALCLLTLGVLCNAHAWAQEPDPASATEEEEAEPEGKFRAFIVVCQRYPQAELRDLPNAWAEARDVQAQLKQLGYEEVVLISDELAEATKRPTRANIEREFAALTRRANENDTLFVLLSMHGLTVNGESAFLTLDYSRRSGAGYVSANRLFSMVEASKAKNAIFVAEACRTANTEFVERMADVPPNVLVFNSCSEGQSSFITEGLGETREERSKKRSIFLYYLIEGLKEADYVVGGNNGRLTASELFNYVAPRTQSFHPGLRQTPRIIGEGGSFAIGVHPATSPYLRLRIPPDERLYVSLQNLATAGNQALRRVKDHYTQSYLESLYIMTKYGPRQQFGQGRFAHRFQALRGYADMAVADYARGLLQYHWRTEVLKVCELCFDLDIEIRNDPSTLAYRADAYRALGMFSEALTDCNDAGIELQLFATLDRPVFSAPFEGYALLESRTLPGEENEPESENPNDAASTAGLAGLLGGDVLNMPSAPTGPLNDEELEVAAAILAAQSGVSIPASQLQAFREEIPNGYGGLSANDIQAIRNLWVAYKQQCAAEGETPSVAGFQGDALAELEILRLALSSGVISPYPGAMPEPPSMTRNEFIEAHFLGRIYDVWNPTPETEEGETEEAIAGDPGMVEEASEGEMQESEIPWFLVVNEVRGDLADGKARWLHVTIRGDDQELEPIDCWIQAEDMFWDPGLAEVLWAPIGQHSQAYKHNLAVVQMRVQRIHNAVRIYETVARFVSMAGVGMPSIGGYVAIAEKAIRTIVQQRISSRQAGTKRGVETLHTSPWWMTMMNREIDQFKSQFEEEKPIDSGTESLE